MAAARGGSEMAGSPVETHREGQNAVLEDPPPQDIKFSAQRAYLAHAAPHVLDGFGALETSPTPSMTPNSTSSSRSPSPSQSTKRKALASTKHTVPPNFRGPVPRDSDPEDVAPSPSLHLVSSSSQPPQLYQTQNTPFNRNSWRYTFAGPWTRELPYSVYRNIPVQPEGIHWDWSDRSGFTHITADASVVSADKGWRSARGNIPVREGSWYCEVEILPPVPVAGMKDGSHVRLGWGRREAPLNAPVGFDGYSYGLRDTTGQRVFLSRPGDYGQPFTKPGDVIGMYIHIPPLSRPNPRDPRDPRHIRRKRIPIRYRGQLYFEQLEYPHSKEMEHLLERSWKGEQLVRSDGTLGCVGDDRGLDVQSTALSIEEEEAQRGQRRHHKHSKQPQYDVAPSNPTAPPGMGGRHALVEPLPQPQPPPQPSHPSSKSKQKGVKGTGPKKKSKSDMDADERDKSKSASFRPLPTLGSESRIGFFLNGRPLGWAFKDLLDFRPLRVEGSGGVQAESSTKKSKKAKRQAEEGDDDPDSLLHSSLSLDPEELSALTTSASSSAILKSRENIHDDGSTGYFPFVSMYGGARVRLRSRTSEFTALPSSARIETGDEDTILGLEESLNEVHNIVSSDSSSSSTRPLSSLSKEYWTSQNAIDIHEEERAKMKTQYLIAKYGESYGREESDEEEQHDGGGAPMGGVAALGANRKRKQNRNKSESESARATPAAVPHLEQLPGEVKMELDDGHEHEHEHEDGSLRSHSQYIDHGIDETPASPDADVQESAQSPPMHEDTATPIRTPTPTPAIGNHEQEENNEAEEIVMRARLIQEHAQQGASADADAGEGDDRERHDE